MRSSWPHHGRSPSSVQTPGFQSCTPRTKGEPSPPAENAVWIVKTDNCHSLACVARSLGHVMAIDFSVRDVLYRHCLYFSSVLLVQPPSSSTACCSAGGRRDGPAPCCFSSTPFILPSPSPVPSRQLPVPLPAPGQPLPRSSTAPSSASGRGPLPGTPPSKL